LYIDDYFTVSQGLPVQSPAELECYRGIVDISFR
jgi:hypothetical protein